MPDFNLFEPTTEIYLSSTGIDDYNKVYFYNNVIAGSWVIARAVGTFTEYSYQRADERQYCAVYGNYYDYIDCDMICWANINMNAYSESGQFFYIFGNITQLEWKNPNCFWVWFKVDPYMTYCGNINWESSYCYVEREHVTNDWRESGLPYWSNMGVAEDIPVEPEITLNQTQFFYEPDTILIISPYDSSGNERALGAWSQHVFTGLNFYEFSDADSANAYIQTIMDSSTASIENIVSIKSVPSEFLRSEYAYVESPEAPWTRYTDICNAKCFSSQFCVLQISSMLSETKRYAPEYFVGSSGTTYMFSEHRVVGPAVCGLVLEPVGYGYIFSEITALNNYVTITDLPEGVCTSNTYAQWRATQGNYLLANTLLSSASSIVGGATRAVSSDSISTAGAVSSVASGALNAVSNAVSAAQQFAQAKKYGTMLIGSSNTSANLAAADNGYGYVISWVVPFSATLYALDDYFSRFGYQVNRLKAPNVNTRPHWNYVKTGEAHIAGDVPYLYRVQIENMLNHGVTFWNEDWTIGDYSDKAGNMG